MTNSFELGILDIATEDYYGLWEVLWAAKEYFPELGPCDLFLETKLRIFEMVEEGLIQIFWLSPSLEEIVLAEDWKEQLENPENWDIASADRWHLRIASTEKGNQIYFSGGDASSPN